MPTSPGEPVADPRPGGRSDDSGPSATVVAEIEGEIVGTVIGSSSAAIGWVHRLILLPGSPRRQRSRRAARPDRAVACRAGSATLGALVTEGERSHKHLERWDYRPSDVGYLERPVTATTSVPTDLAAVWGRKINPGLWSELKGLEDAKQIIERGSFSRSRSRSSPPGTRSPHRAP